LGSDQQEDYNPGENIFSENGNNDMVFALYNNTPNEVKALHNCWIEGQQSTEEDVEGVIFHKNDDDSLGEVFYDPFKCGVGMSTSDLDSDIFRIYPNPASDYLMVSIEGTGDLKIIDINGKIVLSQKNIDSKSVIRFNLPKGVYIVEFVNSKVKQNQKLIVK